MILLRNQLGINFVKKCFVLYICDQYNFVSRGHIIQWQLVITHPSYMLSQRALRGRGSRVRFPKEERCAESPPTFICGKRRENRRKPVKMKILSSGVVFTLEDGISTSHVCLKGQQSIFQNCGNCVTLIFISFYFLRSTKAGLLLLRTLLWRGNQTYVVLSYA